MQEYLEEIKSFLKENGWENCEDINSFTCIEEDLGISGQDAYDLIADFSKKFAVNIDDFVFLKYFTPDGLDLFNFNFIISLFFKNTVYIKKTKELTIGDLQKVIELKKLQ
jgi:acyl carrier protein